MNQSFNLEKYLSDGIEKLVRDALKAALKNPKETAFLARYTLAAKKAEKLRHENGVKGDHIPSFLIASITEACNLHCAGCYARANTHCGTTAVLTSSQWHRIFSEANALGVSMILLAGGEPLMRRDVLHEAAAHPDIVFPIFTNGTLIDDGYLDLFDKHRNLVPMLSIEGDEKHTDARRGKGVYAQTMDVMHRLRRRGILFGVSITVTKENLAYVTHPDFVDLLCAQGCKAMVYVEYVPVEAPGLNLNASHRKIMDARVNTLRARESGMIFISFPGDERQSDGCLAAGRGFFHINAMGGAEPCPFSPFSDTNLLNTPLKDALNSPLFTRLRENGILLEEHEGGCLLFERQDIVKQLLA